MRKRCSRSKSCGAGCISNAKFCRVNFPTAVNKVLEKASNEVGVVELYRAAAAGGKKGNAAKFEKIKRELRQELGRNIRAGDDAKELKRRLVEAGVIPGRGGASAKPEKVQKGAEGSLRGQALANAMARQYQIELSVRADHGGQLTKKAKQELNEKLKAAGVPTKEQLREMAKAQQLEESAVRTPKKKAPDELYGAWETPQLQKFQKGLIDRGKPEHQAVIKQIEAELKRRRDEAGIITMKPVSSSLRQELNAIAERDQQVKLEPRQLSQSPGAKKSSRFVRPGVKSLSPEVMDDISRVMRGEAPVRMEMTPGANPGTRDKSQIAQLQSVLGLGPQTRKDVGRDLEGLLDEAKALRVNKNRELAAAIGRERPRLQRELSQIDKAIVGPITAATGNVRYAREDARDHDDDILSRGLSREIGDVNYRWDESYRSGSKLLGKGGYGTVLREPGNGNAVKRGDIGAIEADLVKRLGEADLGPNLLAADLDGTGSNPGTKLGRMAMTVVPGKPIGGKSPDQEINGVKVSDAYWKARADLHRMGIAHNDMHIDNVLIDKKGKGRFVDMGLAQDSPKAAFAEAMGAFMKPRGGMVTRDREAQGQGDWQIRRWDGTGGKLLDGAQTDPEFGRPLLEARAPLAAKVLDNKPAVIYEMKRDGFTNDDIATIMDHGIRSAMGSYERGPWGKMTNEQAQKYINLLYEGI